MKYFGTNTREPGHYYWDLSKGMSCEYLRNADCPFEPEGLFKSHIPNGSTCYMQHGEYTVFGISGSPADSRPGCKSIFFVKQKLSREEMIEKINRYPAAQDIISKMPFEIQW